MELVDAAEEASRAQGRQGHPAAGADPGGHAGDEAHAGDQLVLGRAPRRRSSTRTTSTSASPRPPRAGWSCRTSRTPTSSPWSTWRARSAGLTATARDGKTQPAEMAGGTFTITNVGVFGVDAGTPIINPGEAAILCFGAVRKQPWVVGDEIVAARHHDAGAVLRPPAHRRREGLTLPRRRRRDPRGPGHGAPLLSGHSSPSEHRPGASSVTGEEAPGQREWRVDKRSTVRCAALSSPAVSRCDTDFLGSR